MSKLKRETHAGKAVAICKSCRNALIKFRSELNIKKSAPKFMITSICYFCNAELREK